MPHIHVNNIDIYYEAHGEGEPLILIGGLTADHNVWKGPLRVFSKQYRVIIFDNRGAGQSSAPDYPYSTKMMADDTVALMNYLNIDSASIIGHSMGGCIAQQIAIHYPEKINKLVIACSRARPSKLADMALSMRAKLMDMNVDELTLTEYMMPFLFSEYFLKQLTNVKGFLQWSMQNPHPQTPTGFKQQLHAVITHDITQEIHAINTPTLIISGEEDCLMPPRMGEHFANELSNAKFVLIEKSGHMPHVEQSKVFTEETLSFLRRA